MREIFFLAVVLSFQFLRLPFASSQPVPSDLSNVQSIFNDNVSHFESIRIEWTEEIVDLFGNDRKPSKNQTESVITWKDKNYRFETSYHIGKSDSAGEYIETTEVYDGDFFKSLSFSTSTPTGTGKISNSNSALNHFQFRMDGYSPLHFLFSFGDSAIRLEDSSFEIVDNENDAITTIQETLQNKGKPYDQTITYHLVSNDSQYIDEVVIQSGQYAKQEIKVEEFIEDELLGVIPKKFVSDYYVFPEFVETRLGYSPAPESIKDGFVHYYSTLYTTTGINVNIPISEDQFELEFPNGAFVIDEVVGNEYVVGAPEKQFPPHDVVIDESRSMIEQGFSPKEKKATSVPKSSIKTPLPNSNSKREDVLSFKRKLLMFCGVTVIVGIALFSIYVLSRRR